ncbi:uncharacterized protein LOC126708466 [Quercus robur]|uniref:uncharacterized protein LOC126708466 n=1 Tax=Quercus robur TaxID=38942 RepID=UPI0021622999|nr:uncharacterized protein LOC126708466 [Quercus robur]
MAAAAYSGSNSLKEYLKRYGINDEEDKKKKKKKVHSKPDATGLLVVDEDPVWQKTVNLEEENSSDSADEEKPQVDEDIEVKRMRWLEQLRARRAYNAISEDGSGWLSLSPKCLNSNDPNFDMSPPRKQRIRNDTPSPEPEQKPSYSARDNIDLSPSQPNLNDDMSPPRQWRRVPRSTSLNSDMSPPRRRHVLADNDRRNPDISPPRRGRHGFPYQDDFHAPLGSDLSPPRKSRKGLGRPGSPDLSPPRRHSTETNALHASLLPDLSPPRKSRKEAAEIKLEWGKGLAQKREAEARLQELESEKDKPFARTRDDPELDKMLRERIRDGDPMAHLVKKKRPELVLPNLGDNEKMKESGFVVPQDIPDHSWLKRRLDTAPN